MCLRRFKLSISEDLKKTSLPLLKAFRRAVHHCKTETDWKHVYKFFSHQLKERFYSDYDIKKYSAPLSILSSEKPPTEIDYKNMMTFLNKFVLKKLLTAYEYQYENYQKGF
jgi:hypothetical protein